MKAKVIGCEIQCYRLKELDKRFGTLVTSVWHHDSNCELCKSL